MRTQLFASMLALAVAVAPANAQTANPKASAKAPAAAKAAAYKAPRTPDGVPDLQGVYSNSSAVPLERPANLGAKEFYTDAEVKANAEAAAARAAAAPAFPQANVVGTVADIHYDTSQFGLTRNVTAAMASNRTSILVGETGKVPPMIPEATKRQADARAGLRAALGVADVVLQVGQHLHQYRRRERDQRNHRIEGPRHRPRQAGRDDDRDRGDPQRLRTQGDTPCGP
jgi:hypothetical protein